MKVYVISKNTPIGILEENEYGLITFEYLDSVTKNDYLPGLNKNKTNSQKLLFPIFDALLPEDGKVDAIKSTYDVAYEIEVLLHLESIHGAFTFLSEENYATYTPSKFVEIDFLRDKKKILDSDYSFPNLLDYTIDIEDNSLYETVERKGKVIGLSGFQNKFSIHINNATTTITQCEDSNYFMKPYNKSYAVYNFKTAKTKLYAPYLALNEHLFMTMARDLGFDVPWNALIKDKIDFHYVIKRFDRFKGSSIEHYDLGALMGLHSSDKYNPTYEKIFRVLREKLDDTELLKAFKFIVFSAVIGHGDLHAKNISVIRSNNKRDIEIRYLFSPLYDVSTTGIYKDLKGKDLGLKLDGHDKKIKLKQFLAFGKTLGFNKEVLMVEIDQVVDYFVNRFNDYIMALPESVQLLPFTISRYSKRTLKEIFMRYYKERIDYINEYIKKVIARPKDIF